MRRTWLALVIAIISSLTLPTMAEELAIAAAADLNYALNDLAQRFESSTGNKITLSFGGSGNLYSQIKNGAPFDLFFSADEDYPTRLASAGLADGATLRTYAVGHLVLWVPKDSPFDPEKMQMGILMQPSVARVAIANPQHAPYGRAAMAALEHYGLKEKIAGKLVFGENVSQAAQFVQSGNAPAGLIALSLAKSPAMSAAGKFWEVPSDSYPELKQAVVIISSSKHKKLAQEFVNYVFSPEGAAILQRYGLTSPAKP